MEQLIHDFNAYLHEVKNASQNTLQAYQNDLKKLQLFLAKQQVYEVSKITETLLNSFILNLEKDGMSPASVSRNIASMKSFFLYLLKQGEVKQDPSERIKSPKVDKKTPQVIEVPLIEELLKQPDETNHKGIRDRAMLELLYATGIKVSELIGIHVEDVNLSGKYMVCRERRERIIPIGSIAKEALEKYLAIREEGFRPKDQDILFLNTSGEQLSRQGVWKIFKVYASKVGMEDINPNTIRHTFAAHLLEHGADLSCVKDYMGHADISSTQYYATGSHKNGREVYMDSHPRA